MTKEINKSLIVDYMAKKHLSQKEFCKKCGIGVSTLRKIISGQTNYNFIAIIKIAIFMNVELFELFC